MEKVTKFFKGDPAEAKLFGPGPVVKDKGIRAVTEEQEKNWVKRRDEARKNPPPFALVQKPEVYK